jgi:PAS domain S-box-containing protein
LKSIFQFWGEPIDLEHCLCSAQPFDGISVRVVFNEIINFDNLLIMTHQQTLKKVVTDEELHFLQLDFEEKMAFFRQSNLDLETKNRYLESALNEIADFYNHAPCGYHAIDENGLILRINDTELDWLGATREEVVGKKYFWDFAVSTGINAEQQRVLFENFKKTGLIRELRVDLKAKDGSVRPVLMSATAIYDENGHFKMSRSTLFDVSGHFHRAREMRLMNEQLYNLNQEKDRFIGMASHDLQNPLAAISMCGELLEKTGAGFSDLQKKLVKNIRRSAARMSALIADVLNINRIERGSYQLEMAEVDLKTLVWDIVSRHEVFASAKRILLSLDAPKGNWKMKTDRGAVSQIVENLLSNAIKFSHFDKKVGVKLVKTVEGMQIRIQDEGQGIHSNEMHLLYHRFQRLSALPTAGESSTGLGLSIVKEMVDLLKGTIDCESEWNVGTTFIVILPYL